MAGWPRAGRVVRVCVRGIRWTLSESERMAAPREGPSAADGPSDGNSRPRLDHAACMQAWTPPSARAETPRRAGAVSPSRALWAIALPRVQWRASQRTRRPTGSGVDAWLGVR